MGQDEIDKKSIALVGTRDRETYTAAPASGIDHGYQTAQAFSPQRRGPPAIDLNMNCQSCKCASASERTSLLQSFKMACLSYKPSPVTIEQGKTLMRSEVIEIQKEIAEHLEIAKTNRKQRQLMSKQRFEEIELQISKRNLDVPILDESKSPRFLQDESVKVFQSLLSSNPVDIQIFGQEQQNLQLIVNSVDSESFNDIERKSTLNIDESVYRNNAASTDNHKTPRISIPLNLNNKVFKVPE